MFESSGSGSGGLSGSGTNDNCIPFRTCNVIMPLKGGGAIMIQASSYCYNILDVDIGFTEVSFFKLFFDVGARNGTVTCGEFEIMILGTSSFLVANLSNSLDTFLGSRTATISKGRQHQV